MESEHLDQVSQTALLLSTIHRHKVQRNFFPKELTGQFLIKQSDFIFKDQKSDSFFSPRLQLMIDFVVYYLKI